MTPETLGRYEILGELGKGAMGVVYLAQDPLIQRQLAIKTFRMAYSAKEKEVQQFRERFLREAQAIGQLSHPNIVTVHDVGQEEDEYFIAMEYVKGTNLKQKMQIAEERLPLDFVIDVTAQIAEGLACAHEKNIVHRDVKPANIIITQTGQVKITDFGIARIEQSNLTVAGQLLGTPNYMAPEQIQGKTVDARTDIFSLGVLLYEMLTRKKPFAGENLTQVSHRIVYDDFTSPDAYVDTLPAELLRILDRALQKDPDGRYQDAAEMAQDLRMLQDPSEQLSGKVAIVKPAQPSPSGSGSEASSVADASPASVSTGSVSGAAVTDSSPVHPPPAQLPPAQLSPVHTVLPPPAREPVSPTAVTTPIPRPPPMPAPAAPPAPHSAPATPPQPPPVRPPAEPVTGPPTPTPRSTVSQQATPQGPEASRELHPSAGNSSKPAGTKPSEQPGRPSRGPGRLGLTLAALVVMGLVVGLILSRIFGSDETVAELPAHSTVEALLEEEQELMRQARQRPTGESAEQALDRLLAGIRKMPYSSRLTRAYFELAAEADLEHDVVEDYVEERMAYAEAFIKAQQYESAYDILELVLLVDPEHEVAARRAEDIERFLDRRRQRVATSRPADTRRAPETAPPPPEPRSTETPSPVSVDLGVSFRTLIAEGEVKVYADGEPIWQRAFKFDNRIFFKRKYLRGPRGYDETHTLATGAVELKVVVEVDTKDGMQSLDNLLRATLEAGTQPILKIEVGEDAALKVTWMP